MKLATCAYSYRDLLTDGKMTLEGFMDLAAELNFDGIEWTSYYFPETTKSFLTRIKRETFDRGLDISARRGTPIMAPADGIVVFAGRNGGLGKTVRLSHGFGYSTVYGHLDQISVEPGDLIHRGDQVGLLGNSGRSTGPHLLYEVIEDGKSVNPLYYILNAY